MQLQKDLAKLEKANIQVVGVSYDSREILKGFAKRAKITFPLLADTESKAITGFGIRNQSVPAGSKLDGVPYPGTFLLDANGVVVAKLFKEGYVKRHTSDELLEAAAKLKQ